MENLYFVLVSTPGLFASIIRQVTGIEYCHVALAFDPDLHETYSVGRRVPSVPVIAGFVQEDAHRILQVFPTASYRVVSYPCSAEFKDRLRRELRRCWQRRFHFHYCVLGLPFILMGRPFYQKNHFTCSSFLARVLSKNGMHLFSKHFSLVTPRDFYELPGTRLVYEGSLAGYIGRQPLLYEKRRAYEA